MLRRWKQTAVSAEMRAVVNGVTIHGFIGDGVVAEDGNTTIQCCDRRDHDDLPPWPVEADGTDMSLHRMTIDARGLRIRLPADV